jgi:Arc/MetJ-type ribon-helix-helix transcriptional regulator
MNIVLPEFLVPHVRRRADEGGFESAEAYVLALIEADRKRSLQWADLSDTEQREVQRVGDLLEKSLDSGRPVVADAAFWETMRAHFRKRRTQRASSQSPLTLPAG